MSLKSVVGLGLFNMTKYLTILTFIVVAFYGNAQETFHRIYLYDDFFSLVHGVFPTDSGYYFGATAGDLSEDRMDVLLGKMNLQGDVLSTWKNVTPARHDLGYEGLSFLDTNFRGNFIFGFPSTIFGVETNPELLEMDANGSIVNEFYFDVLDDDSLSLNSEGKFISYTSDSSYYGFFTYYDLSTDIPQIGFQGEVGAMLFKVDTYGDTLWTKRFDAPGTVNSQFYISRDINLIDGNRILLSVRDKYTYSGSTAEQSNGTIRYFIVDMNGNILNEWSFQDSQYCLAGESDLMLSDGTIIHSYFESKLVGTPPNSDYYNHRAVISRIDQSGNQLWKDSLMEVFVNFAPYAAPKHLQLVNDSVFGGAHSWNYIDWSTSKADMAVRIFNRHIDGEELWHRDYRFFPTDDSLNIPEYDIHDFQLTPDGGFIAAGDVLNFDSLSAGGSGEFAYFLKVNCLGFLGDPIASASYQIGENNGVDFNNTSIQAGNYTWIFGDGDTLATSEFVDSVHHVYSGYGDYNVLLVAHGCNGINDTLQFTVSLEDEGTVMVGDGSLLTIYPNPIIEGESIAFYVGSIPEEGVTFNIVDEVGKIIYEFQNIQGESTYILPQHLSKGMYFATLRTSQKTLESEKIIVN